MIVLKCVSVYLLSIVVRHWSIVHAIAVAIIIIQILLVVCLADPKEIIGGRPVLKARLTNHSVSICITRLSPVESPLVAVEAFIANVTRCAASFQRINVIIFAAGEDILLVDSRVIAFFTRPITSEILVGVLSAQGS